MNDYFFMASLPMVRAGERPSLSPQEFRTLCRERLSPRDHPVLDALLEDGPSADPFVRAWRNVDTQVRNAVARNRAARAGRDPAPWLQEHGGWDVRIVDTVAEAFRQPDPLQRERVLTELRLQLIEELRGFDRFSRTALLAYGLSLRTLWAAQPPEARAGSKKLAAALARSLPHPDKTAPSPPPASEPNGSQHRRSRE